MRYSGYLPEFVPFHSETRHSARARVESQSVDIEIEIETAILLKTEFRLTTPTSPLSTCLLRMLQINSFSSFLGQQLQYLDLDR